MADIPPIAPRPMPEGVEVAPGVHAATSALRFQFARSGGPGGQNVNKLNTKVELWIRPEDLRGMAPDARERLRRLAGRRITKAGDLHLESQQARSQESNRQAVLQRLREMIVQAMVRPKKRRPTRPSRASRQRRLEAKRQRSAVKHHRTHVDD